MQIIRDTNHHFTVIYEMDKLEDAAEELKSTIKAKIFENIYAPRPIKLCTAKRGL